MRRTYLDFANVLLWVQAAIRENQPIPAEHALALLDELDRRADEITKLGNKVVALSRKD